ncbi:hypothetical protein LTR72_003471 [Exophiala xenobiotica]|nr:hypothetical protein LTR92_005245 [Exophiala xenobiotica]KAK5209698.1 hypothetical protein LTR41_004330 [Exophiala xenobiotica]KAK5225568.1 hypothetical protein LTR72_003471 [Exophiala xenobiotica]KAK5298388.1 hypothetical protein LTR14_002239 [Exophiala xenobiotica]KAK5493787.1 hypothetical protein LTR55_002172 [Exophiala xenobiotica]
MPIKLPKGFQRRKSSANALDEVQNPPGNASSFRVLDRPASKGKSFDGGVALRMGGSPVPRPPPKDQYGDEEGEMFTSGRLDAGNRGSAGTEHSHSTAQIDSAASSARLSTSSTNPSSVDARSEKNIQPSGPGPFNDIPVPPSSARAGFIRSPPRALSFGITKGTRSSPTSSPSGLPPLTGNTRSRAVTTSTASTVTPPRLFDSDLALENSELDGFGNMFDHIGSSPAPVRLIQQEEPISSPTSYPPTSYSGAAAVRTSRAPAPRPILTDRSQVVESSPYSWTSRNSHDGLMRSPSPSRTITQGSPVKKREPVAQSPQKQLPRTRMPSRRAVGQRTPSQDQGIGSPPQLLQAKSTDTSSHLLSSSPTTISAEKIEGGLSPSSTHSATFDPSIAADAQLAHMYQQTPAAPPKPVSTNKVMTPAQWERYKQQKEMDRRLGALSDDSSSNADDDDDEDEMERDRQATKQRRKQEAHLAVYRQQMMKVTGEKTQSRPESSLSISRPGNGSSTELNNRLSSMSLDPRQAGGDDVDEDEDVPLGILAAHGFPNKNRPPTRLATSPSNSNLRGISHAQTAPSVISQAPVVSQPSKGGNLPPFARHLPQDPYYGASLVNQSNRESLSIHAASPPQGTGSSTAHPIHPAGLVGVIAGEERARAARRGSPNPSGNYDVPGMPPHPAMVRSQTTGTLPGTGYPPVGMPGMPPMLTPGDQAQLQMSQQMNQMMQMQMHWMQQMQQMMGGQTNPNQGIPPQFAPPRPQSMHMQNRPASQGGQRTMSVLNPSMAPWNTNQQFVPSIHLDPNYAPSIAPSERSNIGLASRYRPVSIAAEPETNSSKRASTFTSSSFQPWGRNQNSPPVPMHAAKPSINMLGRKSPLAAQDDEDDEQGWAEMKMKKDKKQKTRAVRKGQNTLQELYNSAS